MPVEIKVVTAPAALALYKSAVTVRTVPEALLAPKVTLTMRKPYAELGENTHAILTRFVVAVAVPPRAPAPILPPGGPVVSIRTYVELTVALRGVTLLEGDTVAERLLVGDTVGVPDVVRVTVGVALGERELEGVPLGVGEKEGVSLGVGVKEGVSLGVGVKEGVSLGVRVAVRVTVGLVDEERVPVPEAVGVGDTEGEVPVEKLGVGGSGGGGGGGRGGGGGGGPARGSTTPCRYTPAP